MNSILIAIGLNRRSMMKFFLFLFATACLVAAVSGRTVDYERVMRLVRLPNQVLMRMYV